MIGENYNSWRRKIAIARKARGIQNSATDHICKQFGCTHRLTHTEYLFSEYCPKHQRERNKKNNESTGL